MKKAINVLVLLAKIFSFVFCAIYMIVTIANFVQAGSAPNAQAQSALISNGVNGIFGLSFAIAATIVTYLNGPRMVDDTATRKQAIVSIVFGVLGCPLLAAAGIVYLVYLAKKPQGEAIEAPKENE